MFHQSRELRLKTNIRYCHITLDIGAAMKAYQVVWNNPEIWSDIVIHLGDFHAMMAFFGIIGCFVKGSGFEDVIFELGLCSPGCINGILSGKQYMRCWFIHEAFSEAVTRLFFEQFVLNNIPDTLKRKLSESYQSIFDLVKQTDQKELFLKLDDSIATAVNGSLGKTAQYWMKYVQLVDRQYLLHYAIKTNNFNVRHSVWDM